MLLRPAFFIDKKRGSIPLFGRNQSIAGQPEPIVFAFLINPVGPRH
jgi:hypothetical protein